MPEPVGPRLPRRSCLRALLQQVLYSLSSERSSMEELQYNLLFRWVVGFDLDTSVWDVTVFTKNRNRLLAGKVTAAFFEQVLAQAKAHRLLSDEHFMVNGTLIETWAGQKSFKRKPDVAPCRRRRIQAIPVWISGASAGRMPRLRRRRIRKPGCPRRPLARKPR